MLDLTSDLDPWMSERIFDRDPLDRVDLQHPTDEIASILRYVIPLVILSLHVT